MSVIKLIGDAPNQVSRNRDLGDLAYQDAENIAGSLTAGSINNTPIGSTTASTGAFTTLNATGTAPIITIAPSSGTASSTITLSNPSQSWQLENQYVGGAAVGVFRLRDATAGNDVLTVNPSSTVVTLHRNTAITGTLSISDNIFIGTAGKGIDFSADGQAAGMTSELLDDYEEGTWTPEITFATPGDLSVVYSEQNGSYVKIGKLVVARVRFVTSTFTHSTASGNVHITGLPFAAAGGNNKNFQAIGYFGGITKANYTQFASQAVPSNTYLQTQAFGSGQAVANIAVGDLPTGVTVNYCAVIAYEV